MPLKWVTTNSQNQLSPLIQQQINEAVAASLAAVASSGSYTDLTAKPIVILGPTEPVPEGTPSGTLIVRTT